MYNTLHRTPLSTQSSYPILSKSPGPLTPKVALLDRRSWDICRSVDMFCRQHCSVLLLAKLNIIKDEYPGWSIHVYPRDLGKDLNLKSIIYPQAMADVNIQHSKRQNSSFRQHVNLNRQQLWAILIHVHATRTCWSKILEPYTIQYTLNGCLFAFRLCASQYGKNRRRSGFFFFFSVLYLSKHFKKRILAKIAAATLTGNIEATIASPAI